MSEIEKMTKLEKALKEFIIRVYNKRKYRVS